MPGDLETTNALVGGHADRVADREVLSLCRVLVDCDLAAADWPAARGELERAESQVLRVDAPSQTFAGSGRYDLAVVADQPGLVGDRSRGLCDVGQLSHLREHSGRKGRRFGGVAVVVLERNLAADDGVRVHERVVDDRQQFAVIVSVRTYVPLIIATPSTIASAVRAVRSLRPSRRPSCSCPRRRRPSAVRSTAVRSCRSSA